jgi:ABC-type microcin C transport system permease subunit YejB
MENVRKYYSMSAQAKKVTENMAAYTALAMAGLTKGIPRNHLDMSFPENSRMVKGILRKNGIAWREYIGKPRNHYWPIAR